MNEAKDILKKFLKKKHPELLKEKSIEKHLPDRRASTTKKTKESEDIVEIMENLANKDISPVFLMANEDLKKVPNGVGEDLNKETINSKITALQNLVELVNEKLENKTKEIIK